MIRRNVLANMVGGSLSIPLNIIIIPLQMRIMGAEAFGLLGLIAALQIMLSAFDLGLSATVVREVAGDTSPGRRFSRELIQTLATVYWLIALALGVWLFTSAGWIARSWLNLQELSPDTAEFAIQILALSVALRWPVAFYGGAIMGLQALVTLNGLKTLNTTLRLVGGLLVLLATRTLSTFLWWLAFSALFEVAVYGIACLRLLPGLSPWPRLSLGVLRQIWRFSLSMNLISILALVFTQADRVMISRMLPLEELGYYSLAMNVVLSISLIQGFVTSAVLPALASDYMGGRHAQLAARSAKATQILTYVITLPTCVFVFFGHDILRIWVSPEAAGRSYLVLGILALGFLLNASVSIAYTLSVATGNTRLPLLVNVAAVLVYLPGLYLLIVQWGIVGGALAWFLLNLYYLFSLLPMVQKRIMKANTRAWVRRNLSPFLLYGGITFSIAWAAAYLGKPHGGELIPWGACLVASALYVTLAFGALDLTLRSEILAFLRQVLSHLRPLRI